MAKGEAIRAYLQEVGEGDVAGFLERWRKVKGKTSYASCGHYFGYLRRLGLIRVVREAPSRGQFPKKIYALVPGRLNDPAWIQPQSALYPETALGANYVPGGT